MLLDFPPGNYENLDDEIKREKLKLLRNMNDYYESLKDSKETPGDNEVDIHNMKPDDWILL